MLDLLQGKKGILFDLGWTLERPESGDWMITSLMREYVGEEKLEAASRGVLLEALQMGYQYLSERHLVQTLNEELKQFTTYYGIVNETCGFGLSEQQVYMLAKDRCLNMENYQFFDDSLQTIEALSKTYKLGVISDAWPDVMLQLGKCGFAKYFDSFTISCNLGVFKPDEKMFKHALKELNLRPEECVFVDDLAQNLKGAEALGITPIQMIANPESNLDNPYRKIKKIGELLTW